MFDTLSDRLGSGRLGGVFDKLKGRGVFAGKVAATFPVRKRAHQQTAALTAGALCDV